MMPPMPLKDPDARRVYHRDYMRKRFAEDPEFREKHLARIQANTDRYLTEKREWLDAYLAGHPCVDCGEDDPVVLEFDHVRGVKKYIVSRMMNARGQRLPKVIEEVAKCEVRCANCHRRVTHQRRLAAEANGMAVEIRAS